jgi:hypothetical protein
MEFSLLFGTPMLFAPPPNRLGQRSVAAAAIRWDEGTSVSDGRYLNLIERENQIKHLAEVDLTVQHGIEQFV